MLTLMIFLSVTATVPDLANWISDGLLVKVTYDRNSWTVVERQNTAKRIRILVRHRKTMDRVGISYIPKSLPYIELRKKQEKGARLDEKEKEYMDNPALAARDTARAMVDRGDGPHLYTKEMRKNKDTVSRLTVSGKLFYCGARIIKGISKQIQWVYCYHTDGQIAVSLGLVSDYTSKQGKELVINRNVRMILSKLVLR